MPLFFRASREDHTDVVFRALHVGRSTIAVQTDLSAEYGRCIVENPDGGRRVKEVQGSPQRRYTYPCY